MLRLLIGKDWVAIRNEILKRIAADVRSERGGRVLMVPELVSHDMERRLCAAAGDTCSRYAEVLTFTGLARRVADNVGSAALECMDDGGRVVAMASAARSLHSKLKVYASVETRPEFLTQMIDAVDEFKRCCISAEDLSGAAAQTEGTLAQKLEELSLLYGAYDSLCSRGKRDPRDRMTWLLGQLLDGDYPENHVFYIDGFPDFTRQHMAILENLIRFSPEVTVGINCDRIDSGTLAFEKAGKTAAEILKIAMEAGIDTEVETIDGREELALPAWNLLFQGEIPDRIPNGNLTALRAETADTEVRAVAEKILSLVQGGCRYRDIGIACSDLDAYIHLMELTFHRCGIPIYQSGKEEILQKTVIASLLSTLDAALGGFEQKDVLRYLKSVLSPLEPELCDAVENYAVLWGIQGKAWLDPWVNHPDGLGEIWSKESEERLSVLNAAKDAALVPLSRFRQRFAKAENLGNQVLALSDFFEELRLDQRFRDLADKMDAAGDNRNAQILNQLWEILLAAMEQLYDVLGQTVWDQETFYRLFTLLLSQYSVGTIPPVLDAVTVGSMSSMRCQQVKHLFVLGAVEGSLPGYPGSEGLLNDQERTALRKLGLPLTGGAMEGILAEFADIYGTFCGASDTVTVSFSGTQPSYVYRRFLKLCGHEAAAATMPEDILTAERDIGIFLARRKAADTAEEMNVRSWYEDARQRINYEPGSISRENVAKLYGSRLNLSASQIDCQAECRMAYFLKYGLRAKERKEASVDPAEFGTYVHAVLEKTAKKVMELGGFHKVSLEQTMDIAMEYSEAYAKERFGQLQSGRITYLFRRNRRELEMVVEELWRELKDSLFEPGFFELGFGEGQTVDPIDISGKHMPALLRGFVDRVDLWRSEGNTYFRVVDYKTGKKDFDYCDVFNGVGLQMLLYLFALEKSGTDVIGPHPVGAGVQYFPARAPMLSTESALDDEEAEQLRSKEWKRKGLLLREEEVLSAMEQGENFERLSVTRRKDGSLTGDLADREQLKLLRDYLFHFLGNMVDEIASGNTEPNPYTRGTSHSACAFCPYGTVCHENSVEGRRNYKTMTAERFWEEIGKEMNRLG